MSPTLAITIIALAAVAFAAAAYAFLGKADEPDASGKTEGGRHLDLRRAPHRQLSAGVVGIVAVLIGTVLATTAGWL